MGLWERLHKEDTDVVAHEDAGPTIAEAVQTAHTVHAEVWGRPGRCPKCEGRGYLDRIDVIDRIMYEHCTECGNQWSVAESATQPADF
jgi:uncharacterized protein (DUF983 family)